MIQLAILISGLFFFHNFSDSCILAKVLFNVNFLNKKYGRNYMIKSNNGKH